MINLKFLKLNKFLPKKINFFLLFLFVTGSLFVVSGSAYAWADIPFNIASMQLDALDFIDNILGKLFIWFVLLTGEAILFLMFSASILHWAASIPIGLSNVLVESGWNFVVGLSNILFIIIFLIIAFFFIFKSETPGMKKALPRLIIVALLMNFSLLFVKAFSDIGWILQNSMRLTFFGDQNLALASVNPLIEQLWQIVTNNIGKLGVYLGIALLPFANVARLAILGGAVVANPGFLATFAQAATLVIFGIVGGGIYLTFAILFLVRIAVIWLLAIISPLALMAFILPQTGKYFSSWFKQLFQWTLLGIVMFFIMGLGLRLLSMAAPKTSFNVSGAGTWKFLPEYSNYLFLIIYLLVGLSFIKKSMPAGVEAIMSQVGGLTGKAWSRLQRTKTMGRLAEETAGALDIGSRWGSKLEREGGNKLVKGVGWFTRRTVGAPISALTEYGAKSRRISLPAGWGQMSIKEKEMYTRNLADDKDKIMLVSAMTNEKTYQKSSKEFQDLGLDLSTKYASDIRYKKEVGDILDVTPDKITKEIKIEFELAGISKTEIDRATGRLKRDVEKEKIELKINNITRDYSVTENEAATILHAKGLKPQDLSKIKKGSLTTDAFRLAMRNMSSSHLQAIQNNFDDETVRSILNEGKGLNTVSPGTPEFTKIKSENNNLVRWARETPAGKAMLNWSHVVTP